MKKKNPTVAALPKQEVAVAPTHAASASPVGLSLGGNNPFGMEEKQNTTNIMKTEQAIVVIATFAARQHDGTITTKELKKLVVVDEVSNVQIKKAFKAQGFLLRGKGKRNRQTGEIRYPLCVESAARKAFRKVSKPALSLPAVPKPEAAIKIPGTVPADADWITKSMHYAKLQAESEQLRLRMEEEKLRKELAGEQLEPVLPPVMQKEASDARNAKRCIETYLACQ